MNNYYKKQVEISREFGVSEGTVSNWIKGSEEGRYNLQLIEINGKSKVIKNEHNRVEMLKLASEGRKFRPDEEFTEIEVSEELYDIMRSEDLVSIIKSLIIDKTIPIKYVYLGEGSKLWDKFFQTLNSLSEYGQNSKIYLWGKVLNTLEVKFQEFEIINLIDLGPGNLVPAEFWIDFFLKKKLLGSYLPLDISKSVLELTITEFINKYDPNLLANYDGENPYKHLSDWQLDFDKDSLERAINKMSDLEGKKKTLNIFLYLGGTIGNMGNQVRTLQNIKDAMSPDDYLIIDNSFDTVVNRTIFSISNSEEYDKSMLFIASLLGFDESVFQKEYVFNNQTGFREYNLVLAKNIILNFSRLNTKVKFFKNDRINVWKHKRDSFEYIFEKTKAAGLNIESVIKHPNEPEIIYVTKLNNS